FGQTEAGFFTQFIATSATPLESGPLPLGTPVPGRSVEIVDEAGTRLTGVGEVGEIIVHGDDMPHTYLERPEATARTFRIEDGVATVYTGDLGSWRADGQLAHHGRRDHQVQISGNRVELGHIEATLMGLEGVSAATAVDYVDAAGDTRLAAYVVPSATAQPLRAQDLRTALGARLPSAMVPDTIDIVDQLPQLPGGKANRPELRAHRVAAS